MRRTKALRGYQLNFKRVTEMASLLDTGRVAQCILDLARNPEVILPEAEQEERADVEPDGELPIVGSKVALEPPKGMLRSGLETLQGKTVWAVDGGALTIDSTLPNSLGWKLIWVKR